MSSECLLMATMKNRAQVYSFCWTTTHAIETEHFTVCRWPIESIRQYTLDLPLFELDGTVVRLWLHMDWLRCIFLVWVCVNKRHRNILSVDFSPTKGTFFSVVWRYWMFQCVGAINCCIWWCCSLWGICRFFEESNLQMSRHIGMLLLWTDVSFVCLVGIFFSCHCFIHFSSYGMSPKQTQANNVCVKLIWRIVNIEMKRLQHYNKNQWIEFCPPPKLKMPHRIN